MQSVAVTYVFATATPAPVLGATPPEVDYDLPFPGKITPDNFLWVFKAGRDKITYIFTKDPLKRAEKALLYSDKRLVMGRELFIKGKPDIALSTLSKGEKYLEIAAKEEHLARQNGVDTSEFLYTFALASLKHRSVIAEIMPMAPEDAKPELAKIENYSKNSFETSYHALNSKGLIAPKDPFNRGNQTLR